MGDKSDIYYGPFINTESSGERDGTRSLTRPQPNPNSNEILSQTHHCIRPTTIITVIRSLGRIQDGWMSGWVDGGQ